MANLEDVVLSQFLSLEGLYPQMPPHAQMHIKVLRKKWVEQYGDGIAKKRGSGGIGYDHYRDRISKLEKEVEAKRFVIVNTRNALKASNLVVRQHEEEIFRLQQQIAVLESGLLAAARTKMLPISA